MQESFGFNVKFHYHLDISGGTYEASLLPRRDLKTFCLFGPVLEYLCEADLFRSNLDNIFW